MSETIQKSLLNEALSKAQGEFKTPTLNRTAKIKNSEGKLLYETNYADIQECISCIKEALAKNELSFTQITDFVHSPKEMWILKLTLRHSSGETIDSILPINVTQTPQQLGGALTYFKRYQMSAFFGLAADYDDDGNAAEGAKATHEGQPKDKNKSNQGSQNSAPKSGTTKPADSKPANVAPKPDSADDALLKRIDDLLAIRPGVNAEDVNYYLKCCGVGEKDPVTKGRAEAIINMLTPEDCSSEEIRATADEIRQAAAKPKGKPVGEYVVTFGKETSGKKISEIPEKVLRDMNAWATAELGKPTPAVARGDLFNFQTELKTFFKSMDLSL